MNRIRILRFVTFFVTFGTIRYVDKEDLPQEKRSEENGCHGSLWQGDIYMSMCRAMHDVRVLS